MSSRRWRRTRFRRSSSLRRVRRTATPCGDCLRDYIHVTGLAGAHVRALEVLDGTGKSGAYNLGTGQPRSVRDVIDAVERVTGKKVPWTLAPRRPGDPATLYASADKA